MEPNTVYQNNCCTSVPGCESADFIFFLQPIGRGGSLEHWPIERQLHQGVNQLTCILFVQPIGRGVAVEAWANGKTTASGCESADYYLILPTNRRRGSSGRMSQEKDSLTRVLIS